MNIDTILEKVRLEFPQICILPRSQSFLLPPQLARVSNASEQPQNVEQHRAEQQSKSATPLFPGAARPPPHHSYHPPSLLPPTKPQLLQIKAAIIVPCSYYDELPTATACVLITLEPVGPPLPVTALHLKQIQRQSTPPILLALDLLRTPLPYSQSQSILCLSIAAWLLDPDKACQQPPLSLEALVQSCPEGHSLAQNSLVSSVASCPHQASGKIAALLGHVLERGLWSALELYSAYMAAQAVISRNGPWFSPIGLADLAHELEVEVDQLQQQADSIVGHHVQLSSPKQLSQTLFGEGEQQCTNELSLRQLSEKLEPGTADSQFLDVIRRYRERSKLLTGFVRPLLALKPGYTETRPTLCVTGRVALSSPPLQQIPPPVRFCFGAVPQRVFIGADWCQLELRIAAALSRDAALTQVLEEDDFFTTLAERLCCPRRAAKGVMYGLLYGLGPDNLSQQLSMTVQEATDLHESVMTQFPILCRWLRDCSDAVTPTPTVTGRSRVRQFTGRGDRQAVNMAVQGTAADLLASAVVALVNEFRQLDTRICLTLHDEIIVETPEQIAPHTRGILQRVMENAGRQLDARLPTLPVRLRQGTSWASLAGV